MSKKISKKEHKKHVHHVIIYLSLVTAAILTVLISVLTLTKVRVENSETILNDATTVQPIKKATAYGWPFQQIDNEPLWPTLANFTVYFIAIFALVKTEAHLKGHIHPKKKS